MSVMSVITCPEGHRSYRVPNVQIDRFGDACDKCGVALVRGHGAITATGTTFAGLVSEYSAGLREAATIGHPVQRAQAVQKVRIRFDLRVRALASSR